MNLVTMGVMMEPARSPLKPVEKYANDDICWWLVNVVKDI